jgi:hypothetical protein
MGIDGIGKASTPPQLDATVALEQAETRSTELSSVTGTPASAVSGSNATTASSNVLARFQNGEINREQYLELRVDEALSPFAESLSPKQLDFMRTTLREQLELDPTLVELTRRATEKAAVK